MAFGSGRGRGWRVRDEATIRGIAHELSRLFSTSHFTEPHPVSITRDHLPELPNMWVCEKTDGVRALVFFTRVDGRAMCVVRDRNDEWTLLACKVPKGFYKGTVLDGELVTEWVDGERRSVVCVFDAYAREGRAICDAPFRDRLATYETLCPQISTDACRFEAKPMVRDVRMVPKHDRWDTDGFVWISNDGWTILKWKPSHTIDFRVERMGETFVPFLYSKQRFVPADRVRLEDRLGFLNEVWQGSPLIVECYYEHGDTWSVSTIRTDKASPNSCAVFQKTLQSIRADITPEDLERLYRSGT